MTPDRPAAAWRRVPLLAFALLAACAANGSRSSASGAPWKTFTLEVGGSTRAYDLVSPSNGSGPYPVLVFLHGLDDNDPKPDMTLQQYRYLAAKAKSLGFIGVFPRGLAGANPALPSSLGWNGDAEKERANHQYLLALIQELESRYPIDRERIVLAGYGNGSYFAAKELTQHPDTPFKAFWCDAGGDWLDYVLIYGRLPRVALSVSKDDWLDIKNVRRLRDELLNHGWSEDKDLRYILRPAGNGLDQDDFPDVWRFLTAASS